MTDARTITEWRQSTGGGYKAAAKHFGLSVSKVRAMLGKSRAHSPAREAESAADASYLDLSPLRRAERQVADLLVDIDFYRASKGAGQAVASLRRQLVGATERLESLQADERAKFDEFDPDEIAARIVLLMQDHHVRAAVVRLERES